MQGSYGSDCRAKQALMGSTMYFTRSECGCIPNVGFCCVFGQGQKEQRELQREWLGSVADRVQSRLF